MITIRNLILVLVGLGALSALLLLYGIPGREVGLPFETISQGPYFLRYENHRYLVIGDRAEWEEIWSLSMPEPIDAPAVDFSSYVVVAAFMGTRSTGGFDVTIEKIVDTGGEIVVFVRESYPGRIYVTEAITWPHHVVKLARPEKRVVFEVRQLLAHSHDENWRPYDNIIYETLGTYRVEAGNAPPEPSIRSLSRPIT